jgi:AraC family transcriptional regulator
MKPAPASTTTTATPSVGTVGASSPRPGGEARRVLGDPTTQTGRRQDATGAHGSGVEILLNDAGAEPHRQEAATSPTVRRLTLAEPLVAGPTRRVDARFTQTLSWPGMRSEYSWLPPHDDVTVTKPNQIGVAFSQHRRVVVEREGRTAELNVAAGSVFVTGEDPLAWTRVREPTDALEIYPDLTLLADLADGLRSGSGAIEIEPASAARDAVVLGIASVLRRAHLTGIPPSDVAASTLAHRLATHMLATYCSVPVGGRTREPGLLSPRAVDRVAQLIDAELHEPLSLERLAAVVALSPYHFARAFKASTGMPPHRFVTQRRMDRAMTLLTTTRASVMEIAYAVGFGNVSHFRRLFRRHTGFLPGSVRDTASFDPPERSAR